jgi:TnpA family transposase
MTNNIPRLLSPTEILEIYGVPVLNDTERQEYFTFNPAEIQTLKSFKAPEDAVYFAVALVFFKIKHTFIDFTYREVTPERQHVMTRYLSNKPIPKTLPPDHSKVRIKNKILDLCEYQRFTGKMQDKILDALQQSASHHPRQRQLCKELLHAFVRNRVVIPGHSILQDIVSKVWNKENKRVIQSYLRYTTKIQRKVVLSLLDKTNDLHHIISIRQDMKSFNTHDLWKELEKHDHLAPIFKIAGEVLPKLELPAATVAYYATLVQYYSGPGLKQIQPHMAGLYLLCYAYTKYQALNDNLLEAFKKRTLEYKKKAAEYAKAQALKHLEMIQDVRERVSSMLITIKESPHPTHIPKKDLYAHVPEDELLTAASLLVDEHFNKELLFWQHIDAAEESIKINLRKLFLKIDFIVSNNDSLNQVVSYVKEKLKKGSLKGPLPDSVTTWIGSDNLVHIVSSSTIHYNRLEFLLYMQMVYHLGTNKLTLKHSIHHKKVEDELLTPKRWTKEKKAILKTMDYPKLFTPIQTTLEEKRTLLNSLYKTVNAAIDNEENKFIKLKNNAKGELVWRLIPLEADPDVHEFLLPSFRQRSIVEIIKFVNRETQFCRGFDPILPRLKKGEQNVEAITACILANAIRLGTRKMASISDLNESSLVSAEAAYLRLETLLPAINTVNNAVAKLPIYKAWYINSVLHGSMDGLKLGVRFNNSKARGSPKYFPQGIGVSAYNEIVNDLSVAGNLIGSHQYEGNFTFEMALHQNSSDIKPTHLSTDKHGMNSLNFALFDLTDLIFCPRIPKPHRETLWGFGSPKDYEGMLIKPTKFVDEDLIIEEWDNIQRLLASLLTGEAIPNVVIRKLASKDYSSQTKKALVHYNHIVRSHFILTYLHNQEFRRAIMYALNRGEAYNGLYRAISLLNNGELRGKSEIEMEVWNQCTRLIASIIHYYNAHILNSCYVKAQNDQEREFLSSFSPTARGHINLLGYYQFYATSEEDWLEKALNALDWRKNMNFVKKS